MLKISFTHTGSSQGFVFAVLLTRKLDMGEMARSVKDLNEQQAQTRILSLMKGNNKKDGDIEILTPAQREIGLLCPLTMCRIEHAAIGKDCKHIQPFDLTAYLTVNSQTRNINTRWKCPVCTYPLRTEDLQLDGYIQNILADPASVNCDRISFDQRGDWYEVAPECNDDSDNFSDDEYVADLHSGPPIALDDDEDADVAAVLAVAASSALPQQPASEASPSENATPLPEATPKESDEQSEAHDETATPSKRRPKKKAKAKARRAKPKAPPSASPEAVIDLSD